MGNFFDIVVVEVQEYKSWQTYQIFNFLNVVMLEVEET